MKTCFKCGDSKPLSEYYKHKGMRDGHLNKCKACAKRDVRKHRKENPHVQERDRRRYHASAERRKKNHEGVLRRRAANPEKYRARTALNNAVRDGKIDKPTSCPRCGTGGKRIEAHHHDYSRPLDVEWMCSSCHRRHDFAATP